MSRSPSVTSRDAEDNIVRQADALEAVVAHLGKVRDICELSRALFAHVLLPDGSAAFSKESLQNVAFSEFNQPDVGHDRFPLPKGTRFEDFGLGSWYQRQIKRMSERHSNKLAWSTVVALNVACALSSDADVPISSILGQVLWKFRGVDGLRSRPDLLKVAESMSWLGDTEGAMENLELVREAFAEITACEGGRMGFRQWVKVVNLLRRNPILQPRLRAGDVDRLFYDAVQVSRSPGVSTLGVGDFVRLMMRIAEVTKVHPSAVFVALVCHMDELRRDVTRHREGSGLQ